jgi:hypothetical protein
MMEIGANGVASEAFLIMLVKKMEINSKNDN